MTSRRYDVIAVSDVLRDLARRYPSRTNGVLGTYRNLVTGRSCLAGQVMRELGTPLPRRLTWRNVCRFECLPERYTNPYTRDAAELLNTAQLYSDIGSRIAYGPRSRCWGDVARYLERRNLLGPDVLTDQERNI